MSPYSCKCRRAERYMGFGRKGVQVAEVGEVLKLGLGYNID